MINDATAEIMKPGVEEKNKLIEVSNCEWEQNESSGVLKWANKRIMNRKKDQTVGSQV